MILGVGAFAGGRPVKVVVGAPRAAWCDRCMTSSAVRVRFYVLREDTDPVFVWPVGLKYACMVCEPWQFGEWLSDDDDGDAGVLV